MTATREIYWICSQVTQAVQEKIRLLQKYQIMAKVLPDFDALIKAYAESRLNTIVIGDENPDDQLIPKLQDISMHPEFSGVRMVLSLSRSHPLLVTTAVNLGFRDIIALDLPDDQWIRRYVFAASGRPTDLKETHPQITARSMASVKVPARIAWMTEKELWLETKLVPPVGTKLAVSGGLADLLGVKHIAIKVKEYHRTNLHFRYSEALLCAWDIPREVQDRKEILREFFKAQSFKAPYRFYAVIRNHMLRKALVAKLNPKRFEMTVALNKNNMIHEPRFISPDAILIEDKMCNGNYRENFLGMLQNTDVATPIFILGQDIPSVTTGHRLIAVKAIPPNAEAYFDNELGGPKKLRSDILPIAKNHPISFAQIVLSGRLAQLHPESVEIALAYPLGRFGIFTLDAPLFQHVLGRSVQCKAVRTIEAREGSGWKEFPHHSQALIIDLEERSRKSLADRLVTAYSQQLFRSLGTSAVEAATISAQDALAEKESAEEVALAPAYEVSPSGPMRTELARPLNAMQENSDPGPDTTDIIPLRETDVIPTLDDSITTHPIERVVDEIKGFPREWKVVLYAIGAILLILGLAYLLRQPQEQQGAIFTEQLKKYKEQHGGGAVRSTSPASDRSVPEEGTTDADSEDLPTIQ